MHVRAETRVTNADVQHRDGSGAAQKLTVVQGEGTQRLPGAAQRQVNRAAMIRTVALKKRHSP